MIVEERVVSYIHSLDSGNGEFLDKLRFQAEEDKIPIIRQETEQLLKVLLRLKQPKHILEVGTAIGYSALVMAANVPEESKITTIEKYEKRIPLAYQNFQDAKMEDKITLLEGDAIEILKTLTPAYDFIFMDAAKGQYVYFLPELVRLLKKGGILVSDNVLQDGDILESRFAVTRRNRTIHKRMREYLYEVMHHDRLVSMVFPIGDGLTVSSRK